MAKRILGRLLVVAAAGVALTGCQSAMRGMGMIPMGSSDDVKYSQELWEELENQRMVGAAGKHVEFYRGTPPHGEVLELLHRRVRVDGHKGMAIVKRNYRGSKEPATVEGDPDRYLKGVTVMFKRERGYDPDNKNWFWAKYKPDGSLHVKKQMGMSIPLAGRVAKGKSEGCISCHKGAPGGDYVFEEAIQL